MAHRENIKGVDLNVRKPRRSLGTPFFKHRIWLPLAAIGSSGLLWYFYEFWPESQKLKLSILEGKFDYPLGLQEQIAAHQANVTGSAAMGDVVDKLRQRRKEQEAAPRKQSFLNKLFTSTPDL